LVEAAEVEGSLVTAGHWYQMQVSTVESRLKARSAILIKLLAASILVVSAAAPVSTRAQRQQAGPSPNQAHTIAAPVNLKVLPKNFTGRDVHNTMQQWSGEIGVRCSACHVRDSEGIVRGGPTHLRFADDSRPMKAVARLMYTMTAEINRKFITGNDGVPGPVTCGTCHRGKIRPDPYVSPREGAGSTTQAPFSPGTPSLQ
jgi:hypothetical protein